MKNKLLEIKSVSAGYTSNENVLNNINLTVYENDFLGVIGPNGGGKTTLLKTILGLLKHNSGEINYYKGGKRVDKLNIGYLPQINQIDKNFPISVFDTILSGLPSKKKFFFKYSTEDKNKAKEISEALNIESLLRKPIGELSGGQLQRVLLARAIISKPELLILDEPNTFVDKRFQTLLYHFLKEINKETAIIMVSHDIGVVISTVKNIACINSSLHYHSGSEISNEWLRETFECPIDIVTHGTVPHRILLSHDDCNCCSKED